MTKILGKSVATAKQMATYLLSVNPNPKIFIDVEKFCQTFLDAGEKEGVRGDISFCQSCWETNNFKYGGTVTPDQNNYAGLGTTSATVKGAYFENEYTGALAQIQHAKAYATRDFLKEPCVDPRYDLLIRYGKAGTATNWEELGGKWAVPGYDTNKYASLEAANKAQDSYGYKIMNIYNQIMKIKVEEDKKEDYEMSVKVAIDAGHGSSTSGKRTVDGYKEHYINVKTAYYCEQLLQANGVQTVRIGWNDLTATDDPDVALSTRQKQIKAAGCDYSVSFHANASGDGKKWNSVRGVSTHIHNNSSYVKDSNNLAKAVQARLIKGTSQPNRGVVKQALAMCNCPTMGTKGSILCEIGFMTNESEAALMKTTAFCKEQGEDAARGILDYLGIKVGEYNPPANNNGAFTDTYTVVKGDTLSKIGVKLGIDWNEIAKLNGLKSPYAITVGQKLKLPVTDNTPVDVPAVYEVQKGDTLSGIGKKFGIDWNEIAKLNGLKSPYAITVGQKLKLTAVQNATGYDLIFNHTYYANKYADLKAAFGTDKALLLKHFKTYGMKEARQAISTFNVQVYRANNADLQKAFGNDWVKYYEHYMNYGYKETHRTVV